MKVDLQALVYNKEKKGDVKRLRKEGKIPAVLYGHKDKPKRIYVVEKEFKGVLDILKKEAVTINLKVDNKTYPCLIKVVQHNPINDNLLHIDFQHILKKEKIKATIPIHPLGEAPGIKKGGILDQHLYEVVVKCLPDDMPSHIDVDISKLDLNSTIHLKDIKLPNIEFELNLETTVISVLTPKVEKVAPKPTVEEVAIEGEAAEKAKEEKPKEEKEKEEKLKEESKPAKEIPIKGK